MLERTKYLPLTRDFVFKAVFSGNGEESKKALIMVLNVILECEDDPIIDLEYKNTISVPNNTKKKTIINDIKVEAIAKTQKKERISIEMQVRNVEYYVSRSIYYQAVLLTEGLEKGYDYDRIKKSILINIVKGKLFEESQEVHSKFLFKEAKSNRVLSDISEIHFIELGKIDLKGGEIDEMTTIDKLGAFMLYTGRKDKEKEIEKLLETREEVILMTERLLEKASAEELLRAEEFSREMWEHDQASYMAEMKRKGLKEGLEKGLAEGLEKGRAEGLKAAATKMKEKNMPVSEISEITGLTTEEIKAL